MHDPRYNDLIQKFDMSPDEFFEKRNKSEIFRKVVELLMSNYDVYKLINELICITEEGRNNLLEVIKLYHKPHPILKEQLDKIDKINIEAVKNKKT